MRRDVHAAYPLSRTCYSFVHHDVHYRGTFAPSVGREPSIWVSCSGLRNLEVVGFDVSDECNPAGYLPLRPLGPTGQAPLWFIPGTTLLTRHGDLTL